jgi:hypothetical protein
VSPRVRLDVDALLDGYEFISVVPTERQEVPRPRDAFDQE